MSIWHGAVSIWLAALGYRMPIRLARLFSQRFLLYPVLSFSPGDRQPAIEDISKSIEDADSLVSQC